MLKNLSLFPKSKVSQNNGPQSLEWSFWMIFSVKPSWMGFVWSVGNLKHVELLSDVILMNDELVKAVNQDFSNSKVSSIPAGHVT